MSGVDAYRNTMNQAQTQSGTTRDTEYRLLGQATAALMKAQGDMGDSETNPQKMAAFVDAWNWNKQIWDVFMEEAGAEDNPLPKELRAAIVSLGIWVNRETALVLEEQGDIDSLIAVNKDIMKGLRPKQEATAGSDAPAAPPAVSGARTIIDSA